MLTPLKGAHDLGARAFDVPAPRAARGASHSGALVAAVLALAAALLLALAGNAHASLYWANTKAPASIAKVGLDGTTGRNAAFVTGVSGPAGVAVDGSHVYWINRTTRTIGRANLDGTDANQSFIQIPVAANPDGIEVSGEYIYWSNRGIAFPAGNRTIGRVKTDGTGLNQDFIVASQNIRDVTVRGDYIYWNEPNRNSIGRANLDGTGANETFIANVGDTWSIAANATYLYWTSNADPSAIGRAKLDGTGKNLTFISGLGNSYVTKLDIDDSHIYWGNNFTKSIARANLDGTNVNKTFVAAEQATASDSYGIAVQHATTTAVACDPSTVVLPGSSTCTVTLTDTESTIGAPTGPVAISTTGGGALDAATCTPVPVAETPNVATCSVGYTPAAVETGTVTASYAGNGSYAASTDDAELAAVQDATTTDVACDPSPVVLPGSTTCTVTVTDTDSTTSTPTGDVTLSTSGSGSFDMTTCTPTASTETPNVATCTVTYMPTAVETATITASYAGDAGHEASSDTVDVSVLAAPPHETQTTITCPSDMWGKPVQCKVAVKDIDPSASGPPTGDVTVSSSTDGTFESATCTLVQVGFGPDGGCTVTYTPTVGTQTLTATMPGSESFVTSTGTVELKAQPHRPSATVTCGDQPIPSGSPGTCTVTLIDPAAAPAAPVGRVKFYTDGNGTFAPLICTLTAAGADRSSCTVQYTPGDVREDVLGVAFQADDAQKFGPANAGTTVAVTVAKPKPVPPTPPAPPAPPTPKPPVTPVPPTPPAAPKAPQVGKISTKQKTTFAKGGTLTLRVTPGGAGTISVKATAKIGKKTVTVATASVKATKSAPYSLKLKLSKKARTQLRKAKSLKVTIVTTVGSTKKTTTLTLKAPSKKQAKKK